METSLFNVYFAKLDKGTVKPVRWGVSDEHLDQVKSFGVKKLEDFTWKHMLDFYSCADCGRCSDNCPANAVGRPLSPRFLTIKARDYTFQHFPLFGKVGNGTPLVSFEGIYSEDEVWSCTTCGACEEECPLLIEYIDKIVDLRRGLVDDGNVPKSIQKALKALESRGNPYGKMEKKKADWTKDKEFQPTCSVKILDGKNNADTLYFVDSITSYDDRIQAIGRATARILDQVGDELRHPGRSGKRQRTRRSAFRRRNTFHGPARSQRRGHQGIGSPSASSPADPHAFNALKHDYKDMPPVEHISQVMAREVKSGNLKLNPVENAGNVYAYHDPCYLGRHNQVLRRSAQCDRRDSRPEAGRNEPLPGSLVLLRWWRAHVVLRAQRRMRMGVKRVQMAAEAGANVIVTACPFCMVNMEDAIKVAGMEGKMTAIDLTELVDKHVVREHGERTQQLAEPVKA